MTAARYRRHRLATFAVLGLAAVATIALGQRSPAADLLREAKMFEGKRDYLEADESYGLLVRRFPESREAEEATLALARSRRRDGNNAAAYALLDSAIDSEKHQNSSLSAATWLLRAQYRVLDAQSSQDLKEARRQLGRVPVLFGIERYPTLDARVESRLGSGELNLLLGQPDAAAIDFLEAIEDEPASPWLSRARVGLAKSFLSLGDWQAAAEILQRVSEGPGAVALQSEAGRLLTFLHRHFLRPSRGEERWQRSRSLSASGLAWKKPSRVAVASDGRVAILDRGAKLAVVFEPDGTIAQRISSRDARDVWWAFDGNPFLAGPDSVRGLEDSIRLTFAVQGGAKERMAKNIAAGQTGPFGHWLLVDRERKALMIFRKSGVFQRAVAGQEIVDVAIGPRGRVFILDRKRKRISRLDLDFRETGSFSGNWRRPQALAVDGAGNMYVADAAERKISVLAPSGETLETLGPTLPGGVTLGNLEDLTIDGEGRLYILDSKSAKLIVLE